MNVLILVGGAFLFCLIGQATTAIVFVLLCFVGGMDDATAVLTIFALWVPWMWGRLAKG